MLLDLRSEVLTGALIQSLLQCLTGCTHGTVLDRTGAFADSAPVALTAATEK